MLDKYWFHTIDLGDEITPGKKDTIKEKDLWELSPDWFKGKTVLDIGAWDGFYSFYAEICGASRVLAIDSFVWNNPKRGKHCFNYAHDKLQSKVESLYCSIKEIPVKIKEEFDRVLFCGVFYHLKNPFLGLENACDTLKIGGEILIESYIETDDEFPMMKLFGNEFLQNDPTNFWAPNKKCLIQMLGLLGVNIYKEIDMGNRIALYGKKNRTKSKRMLYD